MCHRPQTLVAGNRGPMKIVNSDGAIISNYTQQYCCYRSSFFSQHIRPLQPSTVASAATVVAIHPTPLGLDLLFTALHQK